jgi:hypothetical protein
MMARGEAGQLSVLLIFLKYLAFVNVHSARSRRALEIQVFRSAGLGLVRPGSRIMVTGYLLHVCD